MSKLDDLIAELCPNGVEYKKLIDVAELTMGTSPNGNTVSDNPLNGIEFHQGKSFFGEMILNCSDLYTSSPIKIANAGNIVMSVRAPVGDTNITDRKIAIGRGLCAMIGKPILNTKYLYYFLNANIENIKKKSTGATFGSINTNDIKSIYLPLPPLEVQKEIVRILDNFTELTARKKQYEYYENKVLFENKYDKKTLREVCNVNQGLQIPIIRRKKEKVDNSYFYITVQFLKGTEDIYYIENPHESVICYEDDILVTRTGSTGKIITGVKGCFHNNFFKVNCFDSINKRYLYYVLKSQKMYNIMIRVASGGTIPDLPHGKFYNLEIPVPPLEEQERIVSILDRFDKLCNDISEGLPAEIESRRKQYEYYRDKLLTFEELSE